VRAARAGDSRPVAHVRRDRGHRAPRGVARAFGLAACAVSATGAAGTGAMAAYFCPEEIRAFEHARALASELGGNTASE